MPPSGSRPTASTRSRMRAVAARARGGADGAVQPLRHQGPARRRAARPRARPLRARSAERRLDRGPARLRPRPPAAAGATIPGPWRRCFNQPNPGLGAVRIGEFALAILRRGGLSDDRAVATFSGLIALNYGWSSFTAARDLDPAARADVGAALARCRASRSRAPSRSPPRWATTAATTTTSSCSTSSSAVCARRRASLDRDGAAHRPRPVRDRRRRPPTGRCRTATALRCPSAGAGAASSRSSTTRSSSSRTSRSSRPATARSRAPGCCCPTSCRAGWPRGTVFTLLEGDRLVARATCSVSMTIRRRSRSAIWPPRRPVASMRASPEGCRLRRCAPSPARRAGTWSSSRARTACTAARGSGSTGTRATFARCPRRRMREPRPDRLQRRGRRRAALPACPLTRTRPADGDADGMGSGPRRGGQAAAGVRAARARPPRRRLPRARGRTRVRPPLQQRRAGDDRARRTASSRSTWPRPTRSRARRAARSSTSPTAPSSGTCATRSATTTSRSSRPRARRSRPLPRADGRRARGLRARDGSPLREGPAARLARALRLGLRDDAPVGGLGRDVRPLPAHPRHRCRPRSPTASPCPGRPSPPPTRRRCTPIPAPGPATCARCSTPGSR